MNYVSKEVAVKLKEAGFDVPTAGYYKGITDRVYRLSSVHNWNGMISEISCPDVLTAADWINEKFRIFTIFYGRATTISNDNGALIEYHAIKHPDHRNEAIIFAINQIKTKT